VRADLDDAETRRFALAFGAPVALHAALRDGSLRQAARAAGARVLVYEGGEALRFDDESIRTGVTGVLRVLDALGMLPEDPAEPGGAVGDDPEEARPATLVSRASGWVRARGSGILQLDVQLGDLVEEGRRLGGISDTLGRRIRLVHADRAGVIVGLNRAPLVNIGDAVIHIAAVDEDQPGRVADDRLLMSRRHGGR
jgi:predicted deacylase